MKTITILKRHYLIAAVLLLSSVCLKAQITVGNDSIPQAFSALEIISNNTRGMRLPQLSAGDRNTLENSQAFQDEITGKAKGLMIFNTTNKCVETWNGATWISDCVPEISDVLISGVLVFNCSNISEPLQLTANVTASVASSTLSYQWYKGGTAIAGETAQTYTRTNISTSADAGDYHVVVRSANDVYKSATVSVIVDDLCITDFYWSGFGDINTTSAPYHFAPYFVINSSAPTPLDSKLDTVILISFVTNDPYITWVSTNTSIGSNSSSMLPRLVNSSGFYGCGTNSGSIYPICKTMKFDFSVKYRGCIYTYTTTSPAGFSNAVINLVSITPAAP